LLSVIKTIGSVTIETNLSDMKYKHKASIVPLNQPSLSSIQTYLLNINMMFV
jgi:hypothetical protein